MKSFGRYVVAAVICFSLMSLCSGGEALLLALHNNAKMSNASSGVDAHAVFWNFQLPGVCQSRQVDLPEQCCQASTEYPSDCALIFVSTNMTDTFRSTLTATFSAQIAINCFQFSEMNFVSEISDPINPTLASLRTVILRA